MLKLARIGSIPGSSPGTRVTVVSQVDFRQIFAHNDASGKIAGDFLHQPAEHALVLSRAVMGQNERLDWLVIFPGAHTGQALISSPLFLKTIVLWVRPSRARTWWAA
jgi:hypothetical protein